MKKHRSLPTTIFAVQGLLLVSLTLPLQAAGTASAQFLKLGAGARAAAMGNTFSAIADDVTATYWNPAGLSQIEEAQISVMHNSFLEETQYQYVGAAKPVGNSVFGISLYRLDFGEIDRYSATDVKQGTFDAGSFAGSLTWSKEVREDIFIGGSAKLVQETIEAEKASTLAGDLGLLYRKDKTRFSATLQHMGSKLKFIKEEEDLPTTLRFGASRFFLDDALLVGIDIEKSKDNDSRVHIGAEYHLKERLTVRGGYQVTPGNRIDVDGLTNITAGVGINLGQFKLDYAFVPFGDLGNTHRISLLFKLSKPTPFYQ